MHDHPSLTALDLGNSENIKNRNRIYDEGLSAIVQGMVSSRDKLCIISELHLQSSCITSEGLRAFELIDAAKIDLQILDLAHNDLGNDAS